MLVLVGRRPFTEGLGLETVGITLDSLASSRWTAITNAVPGIFAIGDVIGGKMLAHKAEEEGVAVAELIAGNPATSTMEAIPGVVYTWPEVASVGRTEEQLKADGIAYKAGKYPFSANSRARCNAETDGFVKILADAATDRILGGHIVGPAAGGDLIQEIVVAMEFGGSAEDGGLLQPRPPRPLRSRQGSRRWPSPAAPSTSKQRGAAVPTAASDG